MAAAKLSVSDTLTVQEVQQQLKFDPTLLTGILSGQIQHRMYA